MVLFMARIKAVLPSLREKKRYLAFEVISKAKVSFSEASEAVLNEMLLLNGQLGTAQAGIFVPEFNAETQKGIIRVNHKCTDSLKSALAMIKEVNSRPVIVRSLKASGAINKLQTLIAG